MYHIQTNFRRVLINYHNNYLCTHSSNSLTTISSLFQPITLAPKNAEIKKGDSIIKSQKVKFLLLLQYSFNIPLITPSLRYLTVYYYSS